MLLVPGGAPGAGKTTLAVQLGHGYAQQGHEVAIVCADEAADGILIRIGQQMGLRREDLENRKAEAVAELVAHLETLPNLEVIDFDEVAATLEEVSGALRARRGDGKASILVVDSIQTARVIGMEAAEGPRARVNLIMDVLKGCAKRHGHLVIATLRARPRRLPLQERSRAR